VGNVQERQIRKLELDGGEVPFDVWFTALEDIKLQAAVDSRLARVRAGNLGDFKSVGAGVFELRIHKGPGLRIYYGIYGRQVIILIGGGTKRNQAQDISRAQQLWKQFETHASKKLQSGSPETAAES